jgi:hypothetical protein
MFCLELLFSSLLQCLIYAKFDTDYCGKSEKDFTPIYRMYDCGICSKDKDFNTNFKILTRGYRDQKN